MVISDFKVLERIIKPKKIKNIYHFKPIVGFSIDSRSIKENEAFIALKGKYKDGHNFVNDAIKRNASLVISEREVSLNKNIPNFIVDSTYSSLKQIIRYIRDKKRKMNVIAITGSVGKTTTKEMTAFLLEENFKILKNYKSENNLLGVAKTFFSIKDEDVLVIELGTNRRGEIEELTELVYPDIGIITFIKPVHLQGLGSLKDVFNEKISLLKINKDIKAVLNIDDYYLRKVNFCKVYWFGKNKKANLYAKLLKRSDNNCIFKINDNFLLSLTSPFDGFIYNALASILASSIFKIDIKYLVDRISNFRFPQFRMQIDKINGFLIFNDAYNANPYSFSESLKLLRRFKNRKIIVIGDMLELGDYSKYYHKILADNISCCDFEYCLGLGEHIKYTIDKLKKYGYNNVRHFSSHTEIAKFIKRKAKKDWMIFLKASRSIGLEKIIDLLKE